MSALTSNGGARAPRPKVIYVMGAGRSGSTILGVVLGNCPGVFFAGELYKWLPRQGEPTIDDARRLAFWSDVRSRVGAAPAVEQGQVHQWLERSSGLVRVDRALARRRLRGPYRQITGELFEAIASSAEAACVVDTSHYPLRARELQAIEEIELYVLLLVRDPHDVVASFARKDVAERRFAPLTTRAYLLLTYLLSAVVFLRQPRERRMTLFYEDLLDDPPGVLRALLDEVGCDGELPDFGSLATGEALHGNRLLSEQVVALRRGRPPPETASLGARIFARLLVSAIARLRPRLTNASSRRSPEATRQLAR